MKRETKLGIVVAGSFLALAASALAVRMWNRETESTTSEVAQQPPAAAETQVAVTPPPSEPALSPPAAAPIVVPTDTPAAPPPTWAPPVAPVVEQPVVNPPAPVVADAKPPEPSFPSVNEMPKPAEVIPTPTPTPAPTPVPVPIVAPTDPPKPTENTAPPAPVVPPPVDTPKPPDNFAPVNEVKTESTPPAAPVPPVVPQETAPVAALSTPNRPEGGSPSPLPESISKGVQATGVKKPPSRPTTDSYLEEEYKLKSGETFNTVSKHFFFSEKYAPALEKYNRDYPLASASMRQDPPRLQAGQVLWIPPIRVLEKRYPDLIPDFKPVQGQPATAAPTSTQSTQWTSANNNPGARPLANGPGYKTYRVRDGGETMQDIARHTLNNGQAWSEVYRLNPSLNPSATTPIPAGTLLRLPNEARVD